MELWFVLAVASVFVSGAAAFAAKVAAVHRVDMSVVALYAALLTTATSFALLVYLGLLSSLFHPVLWFAFLAGTSYFVNTMLRVEALRLIDSAIFFPIYKVVGPLLTICAGIIFFQESFTKVEWIGLLLSLAVPLLLINSAEQARQNDLRKGIVILVIISCFAAFSIAVMKAGTDMAPNPWTYIVAGEFFLGLAATLLLLIRHRFGALSVIKSASTARVFVLAFVLGVSNLAAASAVVFAFINQGPLGIVYTINSLYILIPIVLSIIFYGEHWNLRKVTAIVLSIAALGLLG